MFRFLIYTLVAVFLISLVRMFIGIIMKGFGELVNSQGDSQTPAKNEPNVPAGGELKKDPVCGTYVSENSSVKLAFRGQTVHFCSESCLKKFHDSNK